MAVNVTRLLPVVLPLPAPQGRAAASFPVERPAQLHAALLEFGELGEMRSDRRRFSCFAMVAMMEMTESLKMPVESRYCSVNDCHATP